MTTEELEAKLEGGTETQTIEFKGACNWDDKIFAKDILAMSNIQDGGFIIVRMKELDDGTFEREGITEEIKTSYKIDEMKDQLTKYANPHVNFTVDYPKDRNGKEYVLIVNTFDPFSANKIDPFFIVNLPSLAYLLPCNYYHWYRISWHDAQVYYG